jgi:hypothetical protein
MDGGMDGMEWMVWLIIIICRTDGLRIAVVVVVFCC